MGICDYAPSVRFPKYVGIENVRLWFVNTTIYCVILLGVIWSLFVGQSIYLMEVPGLVRFKVYADSSLTYSEKLATKSYSSLLSTCKQSLSSYSFDPPLGVMPSWSFGVDSDNPTACKELCGQGGDSISCVDIGDVTHVDGESVFIATAMKETVTSKDGESVDTDYMIPGVEGVRMEWAHRFQIKLPTSYAHKVSGRALFESTELITIIYSEARDEELRRYTSNEAVGHLTLGEVLWALGYDTLDSTEGSDSYFPIDASTSKKLPIALRGMDVSVEMYYSNYEKGLESQPVCKIILRASNIWMSREDFQVLDVEGTTRTRHYVGIRLNFRQQTRFSWFQLNKVLFTLTMAFVWMKIPFIIVSVIAMYFLGCLSEIYTSYCFEDVNLSHEFNGVSARMLERSLGFCDMYDTIVEDKVGISFDRIRGRFEMVLGKAQELSQSERHTFCDFVFAYLAEPFDDTMSLEEIEPKHCGVFWEPFVRSSTANENLQYEDVVELIDQEALENRTCLEKMFIDSSLKRFSGDMDNVRRALMNEDKTLEKTASMYDRMDEILKNSASDDMRSRASLAAEAKALGRYSTLSKIIFGAQISDSHLEEALACWEKYLESAGGKKAIRESVGVNR